MTRRTRDTSPQSASRRRALKALLGGGAVAALLPERWTRPMVNSVILTAHAQLSCAVANTGPEEYDSAGVFTFTVPAGVTSIDVMAYGADGGDGFESGLNSGGEGGTHDVTISVTPCEELTIYVGGRGGNGTGELGGAGGSSGGAYGGGSASDGSQSGGGGGGASVVLQGGSPVVVAGGGGGSGGGGAVDGGDGGGIGTGGGGAGGGAAGEAGPGTGQNSVGTGDTGGGGGGGVIGGEAGGSSSTGSVGGGGGGTGQSGAGAGGNPNPSGDGFVGLYF
jgi:hypothetical protein